MDAIFNQKLLVAEKGMKPYISKKKGKKENPIMDQDILQIFRFKFHSIVKGKEIRTFVFIVRL